MNEIIRLLTQHGAMVVFVIAFLEQIGAPVPALPVLIVAAAIARTTGDSLLVLGVLIVAGALIADLIWFFLGRGYGYRVLSALCRISLSPDSCVRKTEGFYERHGVTTLMFSKFVPALSLVAPPLAGAFPRMRFGTFLLFDLIGSILWAVTAIAVGVIFRGQIEILLTQLSEHSRTAGIVLLSLFALFVLFKWWERRRFFHTLRMSRITVEQLSQKLSQGESIIVLDVRSRVEQEMDPRRIPGAILLSAEEIEDKLTDVPLQEEIVLYCT